MCTLTYYLKEDEMMIFAQFGKRIPAIIHHLPLYPSAGLWRGVEPIPAASRC